MIFGITISPFTQGSVIIIACGLGLITASGIGSIGILKVCTTVEHIHADRNTVAQHPVQLFGGTFISNRGMSSAPLIKPSRIKLRYKIGTALLILIYHFEYIFTKHSVQCRQCALSMSGFHLSTTVAGK